MFRTIATGFLFSAAIASTPAFAQLVPQYWSVNASTGTADEGSMSKVAFNDAGSAYFRSGATGTIQLRYPVVPTGELEKRKAGESEGFFCLETVYRDTGAGARVVVNLKSTNGDGNVTTHVTFNSDSLPATGTAYASNAALADPICGFRDSSGSVMTAFDTVSRAYFIEVLLTKSTSTAEPGIRVIKIVDSQLYD